MDVAVNASDPEPFGLVVLEALAVRRPVVAVARGGPAEIVDEAVTGRLVPQPAPERLATALAPLVDDPERARGWARRAASRCCRASRLGRFAAGVREGLDRAVSR